MNNTPLYPHEQLTKWFMKDHPYDYRYLVMVGAIFAAHMPALATTVAVINAGVAQECNNLPHHLFNTIGIIPYVILSTALVFGLLIYFPFSSKRGAETLRLVPVLFYCLCFLLIVFDSLNDILVVLHNPLALQTFTIAKTVLTIGGHLPMGC